MTSRWPHTGAFVLQFPAGADPGTGPFEGRVEHVATGRGIQFRTPEELRAFVAQVLAEVRAGDNSGGPDAPRGSAESGPADS
jgi:hypothetical protein